MGFQQGLSGLDSANTFLDVVGNNISNANTVGYKGATAVFSDIYANTLATSGIQVGLGERTATVAQQFTQGTTTTTNNPLDIAIQGNGFFRLIQSDGTFTYTRNGQFQLDRNGYIVNDGADLAGYIANANGQIPTGGTPAPLQVQTANIGARATGASNQPNAGLTLGLNLNAQAPVNSEVGTQTVAISSIQLNSAANVGDQTTYTTRIVDSTGQLHSLQIQLTNAAPNTWTVATQLDNSGSFTSSATPLIFNSSGQPTSGNTQAISYPSLPSPSPATSNNPLNFNITFPSITQTATPVLGTTTVQDSAASNLTVDVYNANLSNTSAVGATQTYNSTFYDPNGVQHTIAVTLTNTANNAWSASYTVDPPPGAGTPVTVTTPVVFNSQGLMTGGTPIAATYAYAANPNDPSSAAGTMNFNINLSGITQEAGTTTPGTVLTRSEPKITPSDPTTYTSSTSATVYDTQGVSHNLTFYFTKVGVNTWQTQTSLDGATPVVQPGYMSFNSTGTLVGGSQLAYTAVLPPPSGAQSPMSFNTFFTGTTQLGSPFSVNKLSQDGYADGSLTGLSIGSDGTVQGNYSNGQTKVIGQITLYNFINPQGLKSVGGNQWIETYASNEAIQGVPGSGDLGTLQSSAVENSNVDLTKELVNLITAQRSYQANSETIKTEDQVLQTITSLR